MTEKPAGNPNTVPKNENASARKKEEDRKKGLNEKLEVTAQADNKNLPATGDEDQKKPGEMFRDFMERHKRDFEMVVPRHLSPERVMRVAISACRRNPKLMTCWLPSVVGGCLEASALGLEINTPLHHAYLVPFKNNKTRRTEAELIIGYEGYIELMYKHPKVLSVFHNVVYMNDTFSYRYGMNEDLQHIELESGDRGEIRGFYAYAKMTGEAYRFVYVSKSEADRVRDEYSKSYQADPKESTWATDYIAMGCKTALRKLQKFVPKSAEAARAVEADFKVIDPFDPEYASGAEDGDNENEKPETTPETSAGKERK